MISTQRSTGSLFGEIRSRTPSCSTSAAVPGVEPEPALDEVLEHLLAARLPERSHMKCTSIGEYACRCSCGATSLASCSQRP